MTNEVKQIIQSLLTKEDNAAYEEAMAKAIALYKITDDNRHPAKEIVAIGKALLDHETQHDQEVKTVRFNGADYTPVNGVVTFNQASDSDSYAIKLASDLDSEKDYTIKTGMTEIVNLRYMAIKISAAGERTNYRDVPGTMEIQRSADGTTWGDVLYTQTVTSVSESATTYPIALDLAKYAETGANYIRVRISSKYTDDNGQEHTFQNTLIFSLNVVNLSVTNNTAWNQPILASSGAFAQSFAIMGAAAKHLVVQITGAYSTYTYEQDFTASQQYTAANPFYLTLQEVQAGILTHGVHTVRAYLTCSDGQGGTLTSDIAVNRFMVVNPDTAGADLTKAYLLLQGVVSKATNYVRSVLTEYCVFIPESATNPAAHSTLPQTVSVRITDAADNDTDYTTEYYRSEQSLLSGVKTSLDTTIEIENTSSGKAPTEYDVYLRFFRYDGETVINYMYESFATRNVHIVVDNTNDYSPVAGADLYINPKVRNNSESDWQTIRNQATGKNVPSTWTGFSGVGDAWTTDDDDQKVLRVLAGQKLNIEYEPWKDFLQNASSLMSLEIDFAVRNITQEDEPILDICQTVGVNDSLIGMRMLPLEGVLQTVSLQEHDDQNWGWAEDERTHMLITINPAVTPKADDELTWQDPSSYGTPGTLALAKVYINGDVRREMVYDISQLNEWIQGDGHGGITIGNPHADIDIYSLRCYRGIALSEQNVRQNRTAALPNAEDKNTFREANDILNGDGRIDYDSVIKKGKRCLTLVGQDNYKVNQDKNTGYPCYWMIDYFDDDGNYVPELSGTIGKAAYEAYIADTKAGKEIDYSPLLNTYQGSTAGTYWDQNEQTKCDKVTYVNRILFSTLHADFGWKASLSNFTEETKAENPMYLNGTQIQGDDYASLTDAQKALVYIDVLDGWIDGNGMYHGQFYTSAVGAAKCTKLVNKVNVASPMQSHKMGATRLYHDVMKAVTGGMELHQANSAARFAVLECDFFFFTQEEGRSTPEFRGMSTFGQGKTDKPSWGYKSSSMPLMATFEGANNNLPLCDFRVPADEDVVYSPSDEAWMYNGTKSMEYDLGATQSAGKDAQGNKLKKPTDEIDAIFRRYVNFIYCHSVDIYCYQTSYADFETEYKSLVDHKDDSEAAAKALDTFQKKMWWMRTGEKQFCLFRYNFVTGTWVDAGTWDQDTLTYTAGTRNLSTDSMTKAAYEAWKASDDNGNYTVLNTMFRNAIAVHASDNFGSVAHAQNHQTHYNLINFFLAGTDNCSKNTYYTIDPATGLVWLYQDDLDTIMKTDNNGRQTKVYFLDRIHDTADYEAGYKTQEDYEGKASVLFNLIECMWETNSTALRSNMRAILTAMSNLVSASDKIDGLSDTQKTTPWGCLHKYFFSIQKYFPAVAYNEQARLRYEWPKSFGYVSTGAQARSIDPITQSIGSQLEAEIQYMSRRLILVATYAAWGNFTSVESDVHPVGISDATQGLSFTPGSGRAGGTYTFDLVPHQWIYPTAYHDRTLVDPHVRVAPGEHYSITSAASGDISGDSSTGIYGMNYYRSIGNVGNMVVGNKSFKVTGKRLTEWIAEPSSEDSPFKATGVTVEAGNIQTLSFKGCNSLDGQLNLTSLVRLQTLDLSGTYVEQVRFPQTAALTTAKLGSRTTKIQATSLPSLTTLTCDSYANITSITLQNVPKLNSLVIARGVTEASAPVIYCLIDNISWTNTAPAVMSFLTNVTECTLSGTVAITSGQNITATEKLAMLQKFGNIDSEDNDLYVTYTTRAATSIDIITQRFIIAEAGNYQYKEDITPSSGNDFSDISWSVSDNDLGATIDAKTGVLTVPAVGLEANNPTATITVTMTKINGTKLTASITVKLFNRLPKVGDFAYADGEFDDVLYSDKVCVGWVYKVTKYSDLPTEVLNRYLQDENIKEQYDAGKTMYEVLVQAADNISYKTTDGATSFSSTPWGIYPDSSGSNGLTSEEQTAVANAAGVTVGALTNLATVKDYGTVGLYNSDKSSVNYNYIKDYNAYDDSQDDGFNVIGSGYACGRWNGKIDTESIVAHAKKILEGYVASEIMVDGDNKTIWDYISADHVIPENLTELADLLVALGKLGGGTRWRQLAYPAAFSCNLYEPVAEDLHDCYKKGSWYLPAEGDLTREYIYFRNSRALSPADSGTPSASYSDIDNSSRPQESTEARRPWYANLLKRAADKNKTCPVTMPSQSDTWSSTEYGSSYSWVVNFYNGLAHNVSYKLYSNVVRPVAAFDFIL